MTKIKIQMDIINTPTKGTTRQQLHIFYDKLPYTPDYNDVSKANFKFVTKRARVERRQRVRNNGNKLLRQRYKSISVPPPSTRFRVSSTRSPLY